MPTAETIIKDEDFRKGKAEEQLKELEQFIESGKEIPLKRSEAEEVEP
jgi:hypothetical protein